MLEVFNLAGLVAPKSVGKLPKVVWIVLGPSETIFGRSLQLLAYMAHFVSL
jgi:hypothetical protein